MGEQMDPIDEHRALVARSFPDLAVRSIVPLPGGWTFYTYDVNGEWIVQLADGRIVGQPEPAVVEQVAAAIEPEA